VQLPLRDRRELLKTVALQTVGDPIRFSETLHADADTLIAAARKHALEGLVAKRVTSVYESSKRSGAWTKVRV
jgi:bifunctional non-homologous end joining protein LigD